MQVNGLNTAYKVQPQYKDGKLVKKSKAQAAAPKPIEIPKPASVEAKPLPPGILPPLAAFDKGRIPTGMEASDIHKAGNANFTSPQWLDQIAQAEQKNGGMGNNEDGFLAWGKNGFFRFKNDSIPPELSARYAKISLMSGIAIEDLKITNQYNEKDVRGKTEFADKFEKQLVEFMQDPSKGFSVNNGGVKYVIGANPNGGGITFFKHKKKKGFGKIVQKINKYVGPVLNIAGNYFPPLKFVAMGLEKASSMYEQYYQASIAKSLYRSVGRGGEIDRTKIMAQSALSGGIGDLTGLMQGGGGLSALKNFGF